MAKKTSNTRIVCTRCYTEGVAIWVSPRDGLTEAFLYLVTLPLIFVGGLFYTGLRSIHSHWACHACQSAEIVPVHSGRGRELLARTSES